MRRVVLVALAVNLLLLLALLWRTYAPRPRNVVVFSVCSLRADHVGCMGTPGLTPNMDRVAARGVLFEQAYAQGETTGPSHQALFTGRYPVGSTVREAALLPGEVALAESVKAGGWQTAGFHDNPNISSDFGFNRGFDEYALPTPPSCAKSVEAGLDWLDRSRDAKLPFFLFVQGTDVHPPHLPAFGCPAPSPGNADVAFAHEQMKQDRFISIHRGSLYRRKHARADSVAVYPVEIDAHPEEFEAVPVPPAAIAHMLLHYDDAVRHVDGVLGSLLEGLEARGLLRGTLVVVIGDHGWELFERGGYGHGRHGYDGIAHVPLIMAGPGVPSGRRVKEEAGLMDLAPTLLTYLGLPPCERHQGRSLLPLVEGASEDTPRYAVSGSVSNGREGHLRSQGLELVWHDNRPCELYNLRADPMEKRDLSNDAASQEAFAQMVAMQRQLMPMLSRNPSAGALSFPKPSERTRDDLRKRGYW